MSEIKVASFKDILAQENIGNKVVEKLAGNTPKSALLFFEHFGEELDYKVLNFGDSSQIYFERAAELTAKWGLDFKAFKERILYFPSINVYLRSVAEFTTNLDAVVYWGAATKCFQTFEGEKGEKFQKIIEEERSKTQDRLESHQNIRKRFRAECFTPVKDTELEKIIKDDLSCLNEKGVIITNYKKDTEQFRKVMGGLGLEPKNYLFEDNREDFLDYERGISIWRN